MAEGSSNAGFGFFSSAMLKAADIGATFGFNAQNNAAAASQASDARWENYLYNEMAADKADMRTRALYNDLYSPAAKIEQLKAAGLSPSLVAGEAAGAQGATAGAQGQGAAGIATQTFGMPPASMMEIANATLALSEARKVNAEANTEEGKNERGQAEIANLWADLKLKDAQATGQFIQNGLNALKLQFESETYENNKQIIEQTANEIQARAQLTMWQAMNENYKFTFETETYQDKKAMVKAQLNNILSDTALKNANKELTDAQTAKVREETNIIYDEYLLKYQDTLTRISQMNNEAERIKELERHNKAIEKQMQKDLTQKYVALGVHFTESMINNIVSIMRTAMMSSAVGGAHL